MPSLTTSPSTPVKAGSGFLSQKGTCTFKILSASSSRDPIIVTCAKVPPKTPTKVVVPAQSSFTLLQTSPSNSPLAPVKRLSLKTSTAQSTKHDLKTMMPSLHHGLLVEPAPPQTSLAISTPTEPNHIPQSTPPAGSEVTTLPPILPISPKPELARELVDLDIISVDDEKPLETTQMHSKEMTSSSDTENSSDFRESESEDEKPPLTENMVRRRKIHKINSSRSSFTLYFMLTDVHLFVQRRVHNTLERIRRGRLRQLFDGLRRTVGIPEGKMSKDATLKKVRTNPPDCLVSQLFW